MIDMELDIHIDAAAEITAVNINLRDNFLLDGRSVPRTVGI